MVKLVDPQAVEVRARPVEDTTPVVQDDTTAQAITTIGGGLLEAKKKGILRGAEQELTDLREQQIRPESVSQGLDDVTQSAAARANSTLQQTEKELQVAQRAVKAGAMSETMFKAKASQILKKYAQRAPGLTPEISDVARRVLGSDPTVDLLRGMFAGASKQTPEQKLAEERYDDYKNVMIAEGKKPKPFGSWSTEEAFEADYTAAMFDARERRLMDDRIKKQSLDKTTQTANSKIYFPIAAKDYQEKIASVWDSVDPLLPFEEQRQQVKQGLDNLLVELRREVLPKFPFAEGLETTYKGIFDRINAEQVIASGEWDAQVAKNRVDFNRDTQLHTLLDSNDQLGYKVVGMMSELKAQSSDLEGILINLIKFSIGTLNPKNISPKLQPLFTELENQGQPTGSGSSVSLGGLINQLFSSTSSEEDQQTLKQGLERDILKPLLNGYGQQKDLLGGSTNPEDKQALDRTRASIIEGAASLDLDTLSSSQYSTLIEILDDDLDGLSALLTQVNPTTSAPRVVLELDGSEFRIKKQPGVSISLVKMKNHLDSLYMVFEKVYGGNKEEFVSMLKPATLPTPEERSKPDFTSPWEKAKRHLQFPDADFFETTPDDIDRTNPLEQVTDSEVEPEASLPPEIRELKGMFPDATLEEMTAFLESQRSSSAETA